MRTNILATNLIIIDAGVEHIHLGLYCNVAVGVQYFEPLQNNERIKSILIPNNDKIETLFKNHGVLELLRTPETPLFLTGKLAEVVRATLGRGQIILPGAALWSAANFLLAKDKSLNSLGVIDLSASGYMLAAVGRDGQLINDLLVANPRCGAGSGVNLSRILEKLAIKREEVDVILKDYLGEAGKARRQAVGVRADRCGVFSSSATISDKNQGLPLNFALAVTMKSEVLKAVKKMTAAVEAICLTGRVFAWQYTRDSARDYLKAQGIKKIFYDREQTLLIQGAKHLIQTVGQNNFKKQAEKKLRKLEKLLAYASFLSLKEKYAAAGLFKRLACPPIKEIDAKIETLPVNIGLDVGSTMAKIIITDAATDEIMFKGSCNNHGDTIETIKHIFEGLQTAGVKSLNIQRLGLTGSGRYQVQKVLRQVYPKLADKIFTLVENYAHARGSIDCAKTHIQNLKNQGQEVNEDFFLLVDIGGEDTKVSVVSLKKEELFDNAMNIKCSAGTGSLMDTLKSLFNIKDIELACQLAFKAPRAYEINATCAVFLMENARKMQALGYSKDEILASANYAIVENMARTLWNQVKFPKNAVVLLHGQTMLSDPLPLAVTHRLQKQGKMFALVPPLPGHRACLGLIKSVGQPVVETQCIASLRDFINLKFNKKIITCRGAACGDKAARCSRTLLKGKNLILTLGGCAAVNEFAETRRSASLPSMPDAYKEIWQFIDSALPKSEAPNRLVIPRSFAVSEQAFFLAKIFEKLGIPVAVDNVRENDVLEAQALFNIDVCAPLIGAAGQFIRLAQEPHGIILAPQIDFLPTDGASLGRTCTTNQGGVVIASRQAKEKYPAANFFSFVLSLKKIEAPHLADQLYKRLTPVFDCYRLKISQLELEKAIAWAIKENLNLKQGLALKTAEYLEEAIRQKRNIAIVCGREYILNPGIYDSHMGRLLRDKGLVAIPSYALETQLDKDFAYIYWRNPHDLLTKIKAVADKKLHQRLINPKLKKIFELFESGQTSSTVSLVRISTFRCGPDTVIAPTVAEITKKTPNLYIQSDAMIKELAHLENRVNTFINQLTKKLHEEFARESFEIKLVEEFGERTLNKDTDVVYFPTLHDNRMVAAVFRGAGFTVIDNFDDETYDLEHKVRLGRIYAGDAVCAPLAAVFADIMLAQEDFAKRKRGRDPLVKDKNRILVFDNKGTGPCRQGQYYEMHKLLLRQQFGSSCLKDSKHNLEYQIRLLVGHEDEGFNVGLDEWALLGSFQAVVLQGVLHSMLLKAGAACRDYEQFQKFYEDYKILKNRVYQILETKSKPGRLSLKLARLIGKKSLIAGAVFKYFAYGLYNNNGLRKIFKRFSKKWIDNSSFPRRRESRKNFKLVKYLFWIPSPLSRGLKAARMTEWKQFKQRPNKIKIHIEGEAYIRVAQVEEIFKALADALGFGSFMVSYSPIWCYLELLLEIGNLERREKISLSKSKKEIKEMKKMNLKVNLLIIGFRKILAKPLYRAAKIEMPDEVKLVLESAKRILPSLKPQGELPPYLGEAILKIKHGADLFLNVAPEGCMVSGMAQLFSSPILKMSGPPGGEAGRPARIQDLFTLNGEINEEQLKMSLLKTLGPERYYKSPS